LGLGVNVVAMLVAFISLLALINFLLAFLCPCLTLESIFAKLFMPFGYLLGFTGQDALAASQLVGIKVSVNEFIAYQKMVTMGLSERAMNIVTYALCGFSNFSCIGIQLGGIGALVPEKRQWLSELGLYAVLGGALSNLLTAMIAGLLL
jgi:CNT family concentrative nucleoside transporter